jgi:hypothetical protein
LDENSILVSAAVPFNTVFVSAARHKNSSSLYSSNWGVRDFSGFLDLWLLDLRTVAPLLREGFMETLWNQCLGQ